MILACAFRWKWEESLEYIQSHSLFFVALLLRVWITIIYPTTNTYVFIGSICFGSLLVAILQALRMLAEIARSEDDGGIGYCIAECILGCLASIMEYFNKVRFVVCSVCVCQVLCQEEAAAATTTTKTRYCLVSLAFDYILWLTFFLCFYLRTIW